MRALRLALFAAHAAATAPAAAAVPFARPHAAAPAPWAAPRIGVDVHINAPKPGLPFPQPGEVAQLARTGIALARTDLAWWTIEQHRGEYEFNSTGYDALVEALVAAGVTPLLTLDFVNTLYDGGGSPSTPESVAAFVNFSLACVARYANRGVVWE
jgi:hypothetical protein